MFNELKKITTRPKPFEFYTAADLWTDAHTSEQMLMYHLNKDVDVSSRNHGFIDRSVEWIVAKFELGEGKKVADFGCGPGLYASRLARSGARVTGIDFSKRSIEYARDAALKAGLSINYINENYLEFETDERFDLIIMIMCDFCVLGPEQRQKLLGKFHDFLRPGGSVLLDVQTLNMFSKRREASVYEKNQLNGFWSPNEYFGFVNTFKYEDEKVVLDKYTILEEGRTRTVYNWFQYFNREALAGEFENCGFASSGFHADVAGAPFDPESDEMAIVAVKK